MKTVPFYVKNKISPTIEKTTNIPQPKPDDDLKQLCRL